MFKCVSSVLALAIGFSAPVLAQHNGPPETLFRLDGDRYQSLFGSEIANAGDLDGDGVDDLLVGARGYLNYSGRIHTFSGATGLQLYTITGPVGAPQEGLGTAVCRLDDLDGDGRPEFAGTGLDISIYSGASGIARATILPPQSTSLFDSSLTAIADQDGDGLRDILLGTPRALSQQGAAYVYSTGTGLLLSSIIISGTKNLGSATANAGDVDGDGIDDFIIGAPNIGALHQVFVYSGATLTQLHALVTPATGTGSFGGSVSGAGDVDGDGRNDVLVGSSGSLTVLYSGATGAVLHQFSRGGGFRPGVSGGSDFDGDGVPDLVMTSWRDVHIYSGSTYAWIRDFHIREAEGNPIQVFPLGDLNGDGQDELFVGNDYGLRVDGRATGTAFVLTPSPTPPGPFNWQQDVVSERWFAHVPGLTWLGAYQAAASYNGVELATVRDSRDQDFIFQTLLGGTGAAYIGLTDAPLEGSFGWAGSGSSEWWAANGFQSTSGIPGFWQAAEPSLTASEDYCMLGSTSGPVASGEWADTDGAAPIGAILEWPGYRSPITQQSGACGGSMVLTCTNLLPGGPVAVAYGSRPGLSSFVVANTGACGSVLINLHSPTLHSISTADSTGTLVLNVIVPANGCGFPVQFLDIASCETSMLIIL